MYSITVTRGFVAQHFLTVPAPRLERQQHSHRYEVAVELMGESLNEYGYLIDIDEVREALDHLKSRYADSLLNDLPEFGDDNPSVERFARYFADRFIELIPGENIDRVQVEVWEGEDAAATYTRAV